MTGWIRKLAPRQQFILLVVVLLLVFFVVRMVIVIIKMVIPVLVIAGLLIGVIWVLNKFGIIGAKDVQAQNVGMEPEEQ